MLLSVAWKRYKTTAQEKPWQFHIIFQLFCLLRPSLLFIFVFSTVSEWTSPNLYKPLCNSKSCTCFLWDQGWGEVVLSQVCQRVETQNISHSYPSFKFSNTRERRSGRHQKVEKYPLQGSSSEKYKWSLPGVTWECQGQSGKSQPNK